MKRSQGNGGCEASALMNELRDAVNAPVAEVDEGTGMEFPPQVVPLGGEPAAPPGAIVVMGTENGFAVPARRFTLLFGRERDDVHVPVGVNDSAVSRKHGVFTCTGEGGEWWLRNTGRLPIELPGGALMLTGHERRMEPGHTPLVISSSTYSSYLLDVHVVGYERPRPPGATSATTVDPRTVYELSPPERLAITALATRYLQGHDRNPLPLSSKQAAQIANQSPHSTKCWTDKMVEHTVATVRQRLHDRHGVPALISEQVGGPVGTTLTQNLIAELLRTTTLTPQDLTLLADLD